MGGGGDAKVLMYLAMSARAIDEQGSTNSNYVRIDVMHKQVE